MQFEFSHLLDFIFPKEPGGKQGTIHSYTAGSLRLQKSLLTRKVGSDRGVLQVYYTFVYSNPDVQSLIHRAKFQAETAIGIDLAQLMFEGLKQSKIFHQDDVLVFVPPDPRRFQQRGYHLPKILAKEVSRQTGVKYLEMLEKSHHTPSQLDRSKTEREAAMFGLFSASNRLDIPVHNLWIVDDVVTSGATLLEAARAIHCKHPKTRVLGLTLAG